MGGAYDTSRITDIRSEYSFDGVYLDNAAAPLVARSVAVKAGEYLASHPLMNPHSNSYWAQQTQELINSVRSDFLALMGVSSDEYTLVFTQNATSALKLVGECMEDYNLMYLVDSHTSVVGLRALAKSYQAVEALDQSLGHLNSSWIAAWPLQSNFDGKRYPTTWVRSVKETGALSLLDLSSYCTTTMPNLGEIRPDFAVLSFYKIFGLPDLGALLVRKSTRNYQFFANKRYAGGGTVALITPIQNVMTRRPDLDTMLEDGTLPIHSIATLKVAMEEFRRIYTDFQHISSHTNAVAQYCLAALQALEFCRVVSLPGHGPIVTFTLDTVGYQEFTNVCSKLNIHVRSGTLCNIGAFTLNSVLKDDDLVRNHTTLGKTCSDDQDIIDGINTGVIRASFGPYSTFKDVDKLLETIHLYFSPTVITKPATSKAVGTVCELLVYPIKSCAPLKLHESTVYAKGLEWDREFCLINPSTLKVYSLKKYNQMNGIVSIPNTQDGYLHVTYQSAAILIPLDVTKWYTDSSDIEFCAQRAAPMRINYDPEVVKFFSGILGEHATIARVIDEEARHSKNGSTSADTPLSLSNSSPILLVSSSSAKTLNEDTCSVFRPNIVVNTEIPFAEDSWLEVMLGKSKYITLGPCRRCNMVCVRPDCSNDPSAYLALTRSRRYDGKLWFGQHLQLNDNTIEAALQVGDIVNCISLKEPVYIEV